MELMLENYGIKIDDVLPQSNPPIPSLEKMHGTGYSEKFDLLAQKTDYHTMNQNFIDKGYDISFKNVLDAYIRLLEDRSLSFSDLVNYEIYMTGFNLEYLSKDWFDAYVHDGRKIDEGTASLRIEALAGLLQKRAERTESKSKKIMLYGKLMELSGDDIIGSDPGNFFTALDNLERLSKDVTISNKAYGDIHKYYLGRALLNLGNMSDDGRDHEKALEYYDAALSHLRLIKDKDNNILYDMAECNSIIGAIKYGHGNAGELPYKLEAVSLFDKIVTLLGSRSTIYDKVMCSMIQDLEVISWIYSKKGEQEKDDEYQKKVVKKGKEFIFESGSDFSTLHTADYFHTIVSYEKAAYHLSKVGVIPKDDHTWIKRVRNGIEHGMPVKDAVNMVRDQEETSFLLPAKYGTPGHPKFAGFKAIPDSTQAVYAD